MSTLHKMAENSFEDRINLYQYKKTNTFVEQKFRGGTLIVRRRVYKSDSKFQTTAFILSGLSRKEIY